MMLRRVARLALEVVGHPVPEPGGDVTIEAVHRHVERSPHEPLGEGQIPLEHGLPRLEPVEGGGLLGPESLGIGLGPFIEGAVGHHGRGGEAVRRREPSLLEEEVVDGGMVPPTPVTAPAAPGRCPTWLGCPFQKKQTSPRGRRRGRPAADGTDSPSTGRGPGWPVGVAWGGRGAAMGAAGRVGRRGLARWGDDARRRPRGTLFDPRRSSPRLRRPLTISVGVGRRVVVVANFALGPVATAATTWATTGFARALDTWEGPGLVVVAGQPLRPGHAGRRPRRRGPRRPWPPTPGWPRP